MIRSALRSSSSPRCSPPPLRPWRRFRRAIPPGRARTLRQHHPRCGRHPLSGHDQAGRRCHRHGARYLSREGNHPRRQGGAMALLFPKWLPGAHSPRGEIEKLAGLVIKANGRILPWTRDPVDVFAFHIDVPAGARSWTWSSSSCRRPSRPGPHCRHPDDDLAAAQFGQPLSGGLLHPPDPDPDDCDLPCRLDGGGRGSGQGVGSTYTYDTTNYESWSTRRSWRASTARSSR